MSGFEDNSDIFESLDENVMEEDDDSDVNLSAASEDEEDEDEDEDEVSESDNDESDGEMPMELSSESASDDESDADIFKPAPKSKKKSEDPPTLSRAASGAVKPSKSAIKPFFSESSAKGKDKKKEATKIKGKSTSKAVSSKPKSSGGPLKTMLLQQEEVAAAVSGSSIPPFPNSHKAQKKSGASFRPALPKPEPKKVEYNSLVQCMTAGSLAGKASGRGKVMVVTGGNVEACVLDIDTKNSGKPTDGDVKAFYEKAGKTFSDMCQVSHLLPHVDAHDPRNARNVGAVLQGFLVPRHIKSKSDALKNVFWYFFPLNPTNEHKLYRKEYQNQSGQQGQIQVQAKYLEIFRGNNIRQSNGPLTIEFPLKTGKQWSFDQRWFSTSGFEHVKAQNQRPASKKKAVQVSVSKPATLPTPPGQAAPSKKRKAPEEDAVAKKPAAPSPLKRSKTDNAVATVTEDTAPSSPSGRTKISKHERLAKIEAQLEQVAANQERIVKFLSALGAAFPSEI